ncbi:MAG: sulfite exporter TauE/SafE family protein, partial [Chloroflexi bacterium]|nr:sulfite exporter TauE/SafE family protein [Chloroflexota bacterium]
AAAVVAFIIARAVYWPEALLMLVAAVLGGYIGARVVRKVSPEVLRWLVIAIGIGMSAYFFVKQA